ncbi:MAG: hypothetical protein WBW25_01035 [Halobacteriota archaeon]|jgi:hypothetical protein
MKIYVRERLKVQKGVEQSRFLVVAVAGEGLHLYAGHLRKTELEQIAKDVGADIVYLEPVHEDLKKKEER